MQLAKEKGDGAHLLHESKAKANEIKVLRKSAEKLATQQLKNLLAQLMCTVDMWLSSLNNELLLKLIKWEARGILSVVEEEEVALVEIEVRFDF